jgi:hypothetical protein
MQVRVSSKSHRQEMGVNGASQALYRIKAKDLVKNQSEKSSPSGG